MGEKEIGVVTHYFGKVGVGIIDLHGTLAVGDTIRIKGTGGEFTQTVESMQLDHVSVESADKGATVGIKVDQKVHEHDKVYKVEL